MNTKVTVLALAGLVGARRWETLEGGPTFDVDYDPSTERLQFDVEMPSGFKDLWLIWDDGKSEFFDITRFSSALGGSIKDANGDINFPRSDQK